MQFPGRERRLSERPFTQLPLLVQTLAEVISSELTKPFAFFGHSMGALISYELAQELRRREQPGPFHLFVSGHRAPQLPDLAAPIHALPRNEIVRELKQLNGTPEAVLRHDELIDLLLPTLRADLELCETYAYAEQTPLACPISAFGGLQDAKVSREALDAWQEQTYSSFTLKMFPGDHFFLHDAKVALLSTISRRLQQQSTGDCPDAS